jgi:hypothetical protein
MTWRKNTIRLLPPDAIHHQFDVPRPVPTICPGNGIQLFFSAAPDASISFYSFSLRYCAISG